MAKAEETTDSDENPQPISCPLCGSTKICKYGIRYLTNGSNIQRFYVKSAATNSAKPASTTQDNINMFRKFIRSH